MTHWPFKERKSERGEVELLRALLKLANQLQANLDLDAVVRTVATAASETLGFGEAAVLVRESGDQLRTHAAVGGEGALDLQSLSAAVPVAAVEGLLCERHKIGSAYFVPGGHRDWEHSDLSLLAARGPGGQSAWRRGDTLLVPLRDQHRRLIGLIRLGSPLDGGRPSLETVSLLGIFATHAAVAIENAWEHSELTQMKGELEDQLRIRHDLAEMTRTLLSKLDQQAVFDEISRVLGELMPYDSMAIALIDGAQHGLTPVYCSSPEVQRRVAERLTEQDEVVAAVLADNRAVLLTGDAGEPRPLLTLADDDRPGSVILAPLSIGEDVFGLMGVGRRADAFFEAREFELAQLFANLAAIAVHNARTYLEMQYLAISDGLTGIHNYRHFREALAAEVSRADRYDDLFCLLMMDLDHFKAVNDTVGHQQGDEVLKAVADVLRSCSRESDYLARYGGEEFVMILPRTSLGEARTMAERIRTRVREIDAGSPALRVSMSIGVAAYPDCCDDMDSVLRAADAALLRAKAAGRNRVCLHGEAGEEAEAPLEDERLSLARRFASSVGLSDAETAGLVAALAAAALLNGAGAQPVPGRAAWSAGPGPAWASAGPGKEAYEALVYSTERWDGEGYPEGLAGEQIPRVARVYSIVRRYLEHEAVADSAGLEELWRGAGGDLDPRLSRRFITFVREPASPAA